MAAPAGVVRSRKAEAHKSDQGHSQVELVLTAARLSKRQEEGIEESRQEADCRQAPSGVAGRDRARQKRKAMSRACSSDRLERSPDKRKVTGSIPVRPMTGTLVRDTGGSKSRARMSSLQYRASGSGAVVQLGERLLCKQEVTGSIPVSSRAGGREIPEEKKTQKRRKREEEKEKKGGERLENSRRVTWIQAGGEARQVSREFFREGVRTGFPRAGSAG